MASRPISLNVPAARPAVGPGPARAPRAAPLRRLPAPVRPLAALAVAVLAACSNGTGSTPTVSPQQGEAERLTQSSDAQADVVKVVPAPPPMPQPTPLPGPVEAAAGAAPAVVSEAATTADAVASSAANSAAGAAAGSLSSAEANRSRLARQPALRESMPGVMPPRPPGQLPPQWPPGQAGDRERYQVLKDNGVLRVADAPVSTFSIDVDTGSWSNMRRFLNNGQLPRRDAVRVEELLNYVPYDYARPSDGRPFAVHTAMAAAPWNPDRVLMRVAIKGADQSIEQLAPANLVFLIDVSGSMAAPNKLPLLQSSLKLLVAKLRPQDRLSIVTYASGTAAPLVAAAGNDKARILSVIDGLRASGSTAGASGIELAWRIAAQSLIPNGINRILLATDGDFNVGITDFDQLKQTVATRRASGISLSTLGFGTGNFNEQLMEQLADAGDGAYSYIDSLMEGQKVLATELSSTLATIARDVKIQVEFNPAAISEYRLIGYENRMLAREDFNNDRVDAGDVGAGHAVTAIYELTPVGKASRVDPLRYGSAGREGQQQRSQDAQSALANEAAFVRIRYKTPGAERSLLIEHSVAASAAATMAEVDSDFRFATAIAGFGQVLRGGTEIGNWGIADAQALAATGLGDDRFGYRGEAVRLMGLAGSLQSANRLVAHGGETAERARQ